MAERKADIQYGDMLSSISLLIGQVSPQPQTVTARKMYPRRADCIFA
jgi:hypothetical protein